MANCFTSCLNEFCCDLISTWWFHFWITNSTLRALGSGTSGSALCISVCLTLLTPCIFSSWEKWLLYLAKILWESATKSPFSSFSILVLGWYLFLKSLMCVYKSLIFLILLLVLSSSILAFRYPFLFLKCLLSSRLILFRLSTLLWLGSCTHCFLACFLWSKKPNHSSSNHGLCCSSSCRPRLSLGEVLIFSLTFSQALFISSPSLKFFTATNLLVISNWYCFLTASSFRFLWLSIFPWNFCAAFLLLPVFP